MLKNGFKQVGIVGIPPLAVIKALNDGGVAIHDLDAPLVTADMESTGPYLPKVYCAVLRTVILNALHLRLDAVYIDVGPGKCDGARYVAAVLADLLGVPIIRTSNEDRAAFGTPICRSKMNLTEKMTRITAGVQVAAGPVDRLPACLPTAGFWGVPPRDFSILDLFPPTTHVYGWARCMENKTPADLALEIHFNPQVPTVFFAQSFCAKTALARALAQKHPQALYLDSDVQAGGSAKAKIQAFLELNGVFL